MRNLPDTLSKIEQDIETVAESLGEKFNYFVDFAKNHKKLILSIIVIYLIFHFLFDEEE